MKAFGLVLICLMIDKIDGARILGVFPAASFSHQVVFRKLTQELAKRGHHVVIITPYPAFTPETVPKNMTEIDASAVSNKLFTEKFAKTITVDGDHAHNLATHEIFMKVVSDTFELWLGIDNVKKILEEKFDLVLAEACVYSTMVLSHTLTCPFVQISSFAALNSNSHAIGSPWNPLFYPEPTRKRHFNLNPLEKIAELLYELGVVVSTVRVHERVNEIIERNFREDTPKFDRLLDNVELLMLNAHSVWDANRPVPPGLAYVGGLHLKPEKELPKELKASLDASKHGVIYMSFGTNVDPRFLSPDKIQVFCNVFAKLPYDVIWKYSGEFKGKPANVNTSAWWPQSDLLKHPKVKLFITQGGLQSTDEALEAGVPMIATPMIADQWYNAEQSQEYGAGKVLHFPTLTEDVLKEAIEEVIGNGSFRKNVLKLKRILRDKPQNPVEQAVWWTEYALRHNGARHLRSPHANLSISEYFVIDALLVLLVGVLVLCLSVYALWLYVCRFVSDGKVKKK